MNTSPENTEGSAFGGGEVKAAHTPGPWMVLPSVTPGQFVILTERGERMDVAVTYGFPGTPREANARLIAAAPELLAALQRLVDNVDGGEFISITRIQESRAAIEKAVQP